MRIFAGAMLAAGLLVHGAVAEPLGAGQPAGVRQARMTSGDTAIMIGIGAVIMAGVGFLASGTSSAIDSQVIKSQNNIVAPPVSTVVSTTASTS